MSHRIAAALALMGAMSAATAAAPSPRPDVFRAELRDPNKDVPGTAMPVAVAEAKPRAAVIDYLVARSGKAATPAAAKAASGERAGAWTGDKPGDLHHLTVDRLVAPFASASAGNGPRLAKRPDGALPAVPKGFRVSVLAATGKARHALRAPNGDIILADTGKSEIRILRPGSGGDTVATDSVFAADLSHPYGLALWPAANPTYLYVADVNSVVRFPYSAGALKAAWACSCIRTRATCIAASTSATNWATTCRPTTSRASGGAASTAGRGTTWARTRTRA